MSFTHSYTKTPVNTFQLAKEIAAEAAIVTAFENLIYDDPALDLIFAAELLGAELTALNNLVAAHVAGTKILNLDITVPNTLAPGEFFIVKHTDADNLEARKMVSDDASVDIIELGGDKISLQLAAGGSGHEILDTLTHCIVENSYYEPIYTANNLTSETFYTDNTKTVKIRETLYTYGGAIPILPTTIVIKQYDGVGVLVPTIGTLTLTVNYSGTQITSIDMVKS